ncbi:uncharacterized protein MEPE_04385 [Melanopsichium pennsylvanicum]|uniref:Translation initiation factor 3 N-terminal domain-containing protein n=1 Tax=Melanopsichium pennsylvanicum TaxID=63383 RepID=A0AAJ4XPS1_9BASI|nr:uncharacterized protein MEPE_04385 [Melanopsichium pennsylvanicum]
MTMRTQTVTALRKAVHRTVAIPTSMIVAPRFSVSRTRAAVALSHPNFSTTSLSFAAPKNVATTSKPSSEPSKRPIRDDQIDSPYVRLVDPKSGALAGPFRTSAILSKLDRSKFFLQQVVPPLPDRATIEYDPTSTIITTTTTINTTTSSNGNGVDVSALVQFPICKLIDKKEEFDRLRNAKRKISLSSTSTSSSSSSSSSGQENPESTKFGINLNNNNSGNSIGTSKEVQLSWNVSENDLSHKLSKAKKEMMKGARINLIITTKSGGKRYMKGVNLKEDLKREELIKKIEEYLCKPEKNLQVDDEVMVEVVPIARRLQDIDWQKGGSAAVMSFERFRK